MHLIKIIQLNNGLSIILLKKSYLLQFLCGDICNNNFSGNELDLNGNIFDAEWLANSTNENDFIYYAKWSLTVNNT